MVVEWLRRAMELEQRPNHIWRIAVSAARCGEFALAAEVLPRLGGMDLASAEAVIGAARYDETGLAGVEGEVKDGPLAAALTRAARAGRFADVRALFGRVGDVERARREAGFMRLDAPDAQTLAWLSENRVFAWQVIEECAARGLHVEAMRLTERTDDFATARAVSSSVATGLSRHGLETACSFISTLAPELRENAARHVATALFSDDPRLLAFASKANGKAEIRSMGAQRRARNGEREPLEAATVARGMAKFELTSSAFFGYLQGGHLALAEECLPITDRSQLALCCGRLAGAMAVRGDDAGAERLLSEVKGGWSGTANDDVVRALGEAGQWERAEAYAHRRKKGTAYTAPFLAWGRARMGEPAAVEPLVAWASKPDRASTLEAAALGAGQIDPWKEPYP